MKDLRFFLSLERERDRERETEKETDTETQRERDREKERQRESERDRERDREREKGTERGRETQREFPLTSEIQKSSLKCYTHLKSSREETITTYVVLSTKNKEKTL